MRHRLRLVFPACLLAVAGCGDAAAPEAQPAPDVPVFAGANFDGIPLPPLAEPVGPRSEKADVVARSYGARNATPEAVISYEESLDGWRQVTPPQAVNEAHRAEWERDGRVPRVSTAPAATLAEDDEPVVQLSLQLGLA